MKKLEKLKLHHLSEKTLDEKQKNALKGGAGCPCTCIGCLCSGWDGTGPMPPGTSTSDSGSGSVSGNLSGTVNHGI